jgi:hypothetical protein
MLFFAYWTGMHPPEPVVAISLSPSAAHIFTAALSVVFL